MGRNNTLATSRVQNHTGPGPNSQPPASRASSDGGTRLRLRLSKIFHTSKAVSWFGWRSALAPFGPFDPFNPVEPFGSFNLDGAGTCGSSQPASCQSPRI